MTEQMIEFRALLDTFNIKWVDKSTDNFFVNGSLIGMTRTHFSYRGHDWSVIHGYGSHGGYNIITETDLGLLELMSECVNDGMPVGYLNAYEAICMVLGVETLILWYKKLKDSVMEDYIKDSEITDEEFNDWLIGRNEALKSYDVEKFKAFYNKYYELGYYDQPLPDNDLVIEATMRYAVCALRDITPEERVEALNWLTDHKFF